MPRPKKTRYFDGVALPDNLYPDPKHRRNKWRYVRQDGTTRIFDATLDEAITAATEANALRNTPITMAPRISPRDAILVHVERYILWREGYDPALANKQSWKNRRGYLRQFANHFSATRINHLTLESLRGWWEALTHHAQHNRRAEFNRLINYFSGQGLTPRLQFNPFTTADDQPRLTERGRPPVCRVRMTLDDFWAIYRQAGDMGYEALQIAMAISMVTTMRRGDICNLRWDQHITKTSLRKTINKSQAQLGERSIAVAHLEFEFDRYLLLHQAVNRARELSLKNKGCPYVVSHRPLRTQKLKNKTHSCQVTEGRLSKMFQTVRDATNRFPPATDTYSPPSFHEIRGLVSKLLQSQGVDIKAIQSLMAHTDPRVTRVYQTGHGVSYTKMNVVLEADSLGGQF